MKKSIFKAVTLALAIVLSVSLLALAVFAEDGAEDGSEDYTSYAFTVINSEGVPVAGGNTGEDLKNIIPTVESGSTVRFNSDIEIVSTIQVKGSEDAPKVVNFDLAGNMIYSLTKRTIFQAYNFATANVYSSAPDAVLYVTNVADTSLGGCIFNVMGKSAVLNAGEFTVGDVTYPGSNISTYSSCLIDLLTGSEEAGTAYKLCDANCCITLNGGNYYSICRDYSGYIIPRAGEATLNIKNANVISFDNRGLINAPGGFCKLNIENSVLLQAEGAQANLFNNTGSVVTFTNVTTNYKLEASAGASNYLNLVGKNVFAMSDNPELNLVKGHEALAIARTVCPLELIGGGTSFFYYSNDGSLNRIDDTLSPSILATPITVIAAENAETCTFVHEKKSITEVWEKGSQILPPFTLPQQKEDGIYSYGWTKTYDEFGGVIYTSGYIADFDILIGAVYDDYLFFNVYVPAMFIDEGYLDFLSVRIGGDDFPIDEWEECEVNGERYYRAYSTYIDEENINDVFAVTIPISYLDNKYINSTWHVNMREYVDMVLATEADGVYTEGEYQVVHKIVEDFFTTES